VVNVEGKFQLSKQALSRILPVWKPQEPANDIPIHVHANNIGIKETPRQHWQQQPEDPCQVPAVVVWENRRGDVPQAPRGGYPCVCPFVDAAQGARQSIAAQACQNKELQVNPSMGQLCVQRFVCGAGQLTNTTRARQMDDEPVVR